MHIPRNISFIISFNVSGAHIHSLLSNWSPFKNASGHYYPSAYLLQKRILKPSFIVILKAIILNCFLRAIYYYFVTLKTFSLYVVVFYIRITFYLYSIIKVIIKLIIYMVYYINPYKDLHEMAYIYILAYNLCHALLTSTVCYFIIHILIFNFI